MKHLINSLLTKFVDYALLIGLVLGVLCLLISHSLDNNSLPTSLFINLAADFFMAGLTISVVDRLIKRSERQKYGGVPDAAKKAINSEIWSLIGVMSYNVKDALSKTTQEIMDSGLVDDDNKGDNVIKKMRIMELAELKVIDKSKLTLGMFSEMFRFIRQTLGNLDNLIARYGAVLDTEDIGKAIALRDEVENLDSTHKLTTITIPFFGQQTPDKPLDARQRNAFMSIKDGIVSLTDKLL